MPTLTAKQVIISGESKPAQTKPIRLNDGQYRQLLTVKRLAKAKKAIEELHNAKRNSLLAEFVGQLPEVGNSVSLLFKLDSIGDIKAGSVSCQVRKTLDIEALKASHPEINLDAFMRDSEPFYVLR